MNGFEFMVGTLLGALAAFVVARKHYSIQLAFREECLRSRLEEKEAACDRQLQLVQATEARIENTFESLATRSLRLAKDDFLQLAKSAFEACQTEATADFVSKSKEIDDLIAPLECSLENLAAHARDLEKQRTTAYALLTEQVNSLSRQTDELSSALRRPQVKGSWGELILRQVVEQCGMVEGLHFVCQETVEAEDGRQLRPDMIFRLPSGRTLVLDAKCPLESFREALAAQDDATRTAKLKAHARSLRNHIKSLSSKEYQSRFEGASDSVVLCLPSEAAYAAALESDDSLLDFAASERVLIANPATLVGLIRVIAHVYREEKVEKSAREIRDVGAKLYDALSAFAGHMVKHGRNLRLAADTYNDASRAFNSALLPRAQRLATLGVKPGHEFANLAAIEVSLPEESEEHEQAEPKLRRKSMKRAVDPEHAPEEGHSCYESNPGK